MCRACGRINRTGHVCDVCRATLVPAPDRVVAGVVVRSAWGHEGAARRLVHRLKYHGLASAAVPIVQRLVEIIETSGDVPTALVPVPRARIRRGLHGIDPAEVIAAGTARALGIPMVRAVRPGLWWPRHAGRGRGRRPPHLIAATRNLPPGAALVDDVVTTGSTIAAAASLVPTVALAYSATAGIVGQVRPDRAVVPFTPGEP